MQNGYAVAGIVILCVGIAANTDRRAEQDPPDGNKEK